MEIATSPSKPRSVTIAVKILIGTFILGIINTVIAKVTGELTIYWNGVGIFWMVCGMIFNLTIIYQINRGKEWARDIYSTIFILCLIFIPLVIYRWSEINQLRMILPAVIFTANTFALFLLYRKESTAWFKPPGKVIT